jgi:hypothetical protein
LRQKINFSASWTLRWSLTCDGVTTPKAAPPAVVFGPPNHGVLAKLKASARNCSASPSLSVKVLKSERSICGGRLVRMSEKRVLCERSVNAG